MANDLPSSHNSLLLNCCIYGTLPPEADNEGNIEYKLKLINPTDERLEHLVTQMKWRLAEGNGEAVYEIGIDDDGTIKGLDEDELNCSLMNLRKMANSLNADISSTKEINLSQLNLNHSTVQKSQDRKVAEVVIKTRLTDEEEGQHFTDLRIVLVGALGAGKSTLLGHICHGAKDNGRGKARLNLMRHRHELESGRSSSISHEIIGYDSEGTLINYATTNVSTWEQICESSLKIVTFLDTCGFPKYLRTTMSGLMGYAPDYACLAIAGNAGTVSGMTKEHLSIAVMLDLPVFVVITKSDTAGAAGFLIAIRVMRSKISDIEVTLVDSKTFFEYTPALCSVLYEKSSEKFHRHFMNITFDYETVLKKLNVKFVPGKVKSLGENQVYVSVKKDELVSIDYDYLAICTGSSYADPWKPNDITYNLNLEARMAYLNEQRQAYLNAKSILIIGGGPVGVESAAEIVYRSPQKLVTLVNSGSCVLASAPQELGRYAQKILNSIDVRLISNEKIEKKDKDSDIYVTNESKQEIKADLVYNCIGVKPNSEFLKESYQEWLDDKGYVQVEKTLNVKGKSNVFALGDINNLGEAKLYYTAHMQAMHFVRNLSRVLNGQNMVPYQNAKPAMFISMGPYYGVGTVSGIRFTGWPFTQDKGSKLAAWIKYIIEKINVQGGGSIEIVINESLYMYSNLLPF